MADFEDHITKSRERRKAEPVSIFSAHGRVLIGLSQTPEDTEDHISLRLGLSLQQTRLSIKLLKKSGILVVERAGRHNSYQVDREANLPVHGIGSLRINMLLDSIITKE